MKNIHVLPTNDISILHEFGGQFILENKPKDNFRSQHIYITSDEEIISLSEINSLPLSDGKDIQTNMSNI